jgi:hypothetical protein
MAWQDTQRGTGRTTRMLERAIYEAMHGRQVFVIPASPEQERQLREAAVQEIGPDNLEKDREGPWTIRWSDPIRCKSGGSIIFYSKDAFSIDWENFRMKGTSPDSILLIDHHVIAMRFRNVLDLLHRWDRPEEEAEARSRPIPGGWL